VVGALIEVPTMLLMVRVVNGSKGWNERGTATKLRRIQP
jgi:ACR3 family arsenite transporter